MQYKYDRMPGAPAVRFRVKTWTRIKKRTAVFYFWTQWSVQSWTRARSIDMKRELHLKETKRTVGCEVDVLKPAIKSLIKWVISACLFIRIYILKKENTDPWQCPRQLRKRPHSSSCCWQNVDILFAELSFRENLQHVEEKRHVSFHFHMFYSIVEIHLE